MNFASIIVHPCFKVRCRHCTTKRRKKIEQIAQEQQFFSLHWNSSQNNIVADMN